VANLDYDYDFARMEFEPAKGKPLDSKGRSVVVDADRGWQPTGVELLAATRYHLRAAGRYVVAQDQDDQPWTCEPGGVSIEHYHGRPLGILLAAIRSDDPTTNEPSGLIKPIVVGLGTTLEPKRTGTLYLRINDSAGRLDDNSGSATVEIAPE
jgi:hypothetical protein